MKKSFLYLGALIMGLTPYIVSAQTLQLTSIGSFFSSIAGLIQDIIGLLIGVAVLIIVYGVVKFIASGDDADARKSGAAFMAYGIVGIFVIVSIWGLVNFVNVSIDTDDAVVTPPSIPGATS